MKLTELPEQLAFIRIHQDLSQRQVCARMGVANTTISHWENGQRYITLDKAQKWAEALGYEIQVQLVKK